MRMLLIMIAVLALPRSGYCGTLEDAKVESNVPWAEGAKAPTTPSVEAMIGAKAAPAASAAAKSAKSAVPTPARACGDAPRGLGERLGNSLGTFAGFIGELNLLFVGASAINPVIGFGLLGLAALGAVAAPIWFHTRYGATGGRLAIASLVGVGTGLLIGPMAGGWAGSWLGRKVDNLRKK